MGTEYRQVGWMISGPSSTELAFYDEDILEEIIAQMCAVNGDDPDDYTATPLYIKVVNDDRLKPG